MMDIFGWMIFGAVAGACLMFTWAGILFGNLQGFAEANNKMLWEALERLKKIEDRIEDMRERLIISAVCDAPPGDRMHD